MIARVVQTNWHYPRTSLAEQILERFDIGATTALTLFAPPRMGKTEFLLHDLLPMAAKQYDYLIAYVNLGDRLTDPVDSMILGLQKATGQINDGVSTAMDGYATSQKLDVVQYLFDALMADGRRVLLALDEVQYLDTNSSFEPLLYALRGMIDTNRTHCRVIYTCSSRAGLQRLFNKRSSPFFSSSQTIDLPVFDRGFLKHMAEAFTEATGQKLDIDECQSAFNTLNKVPYEFRQALDQLIQRGGGCITDIAHKQL